MLSVRVGELASVSEWMPECQGGRLGQKPDRYVKEREKQLVSGLNV